MGIQTTAAAAARGAAPIEVVPAGAVLGADRRYQAVGGVRFFLADGLGLYQVPVLCSLGCYPNYRGY